MGLHNPATAATHGSARPFRADQLAALDVRSTPDQRMDPAEVQGLVQLLDGWQVQGAVLQRVFEFRDYHATLAFVNAVAWIAHRGDHHPELQVGYNRCLVQWSTHSAGGLTLKDLICAAQVDALQCRKA
jgi:4a-hydroxytetrahydrobiopterin dehydratase